MAKKQKLELTWIGKEKRPRLEPRVLIEDPSKSHHASVRHGEDDIFDNMLIHGDNLLALKALEQEFAGKIQCVYIDPPYNTGKAFDGLYDDGLEHSIWLGLMRERLLLLNRLLSEDGSIWISIDDNEQAYLKVLLDEVFGRENFVATLPTIMNLKGNQDEFGFAGTHEYTLVYAKTKERAKFHKFPVDDDKVLEEWEEDEIGYFKKGANLKATGINAPSGKRPFLFYPMLVSKVTDCIDFISFDEYCAIYDKPTKRFNAAFVEKLKDKYESLGYAFILPITGGEMMSWRWSYKKAKTNANEIIVHKGKDGYTLYKKQRPEIGDMPTAMPKSVFYKPQYSSGNGTAQIKALFGTKVFDYPKPEELIADILTIATNPGDLVLDSFLGSGTSAAVAHKMGRRWIGVELKEHCYTLCKTRLDKVVDGADAGGITEAVGWKGGGGYRFYELAPTLIKKDAWGQPVINADYNAEQLSEAVCKLEGFIYAPSATEYFIHGHSTERDFIYVTTSFLKAEHQRTLGELVGPERSLLVCCKGFAPGVKVNNLTVKKIPQAVLDKCEYGHDDYSLNVENLPMAAKEPVQGTLFD